MDEIDQAYRKHVMDCAVSPLPWEELDGSNVLITGATGLLGSCLVEVLMQCPCHHLHVYAAGRNEERAKMLFKEHLNNPFFHFLKYDVTNPLSTDLSFHYVIHAASNASPSFFAKNPVEVIKANVLGTINLLDYGRRHGLRRFLYVSTGEVYGEGDGRVFSEEYSGYVNPMSSRSCYPSSKRAAETLCAAYMAEYGVDVVVARPSHTYGPHFTEGDNRVYAQFIRNVLKGENIVMKSTGAQFRSWCYVVDCVKGLLYILLKGKSGEAYNVADASSNISIRDLAEMIAAMAGKKVVMELPTDIEKQGFNVVTRSVFSTEKLESLGWSVQGTMREKLQATIQACRQKDEII
ncbi:MAG: NAD-dependent epimerase/dehydratase family protein [Bacteroidaceae bacterium]|nr:NAD-dependent epimerase/dehydratase family protein [Bacteroidaceae bacterium]